MTSAHIDCAAGAAGKVLPCWRHFGFKGAELASVLALGKSQSLFYTDIHHKCINPLYFRLFKRQQREIAGQNGRAGPI